MHKNHNKTEPVLTISEDKYRQIFDNANEAIFLDQNGSIIFANKNFFRIFEFEESELTQISWLDFIYPEDRKELYPQKNRPAMKEGSTDYQTLRISTKSGQEKWIEINQVLLDWEDKPAILNFVRDITQQKRLESRLQIAQRMEAIGTLAGGLAHDFNNILSPIIGYTELALDEIDQDSITSKNLNQVYKAAHRARDLVQQILAFSRQSEKELKKVDKIPGGNEHILLVDDEKAVVYMIKQMLETLGYKVTARTSSIEANEAFENQPDKFDLVLTDQIMPNMTGELLARQILKIRPDIPIILCTGFSEFMDKEKLRSSGINDVLLKPVLKSKLAQTIRKAINDSQKKS